LQLEILRMGDVVPALARAWNAMPAGRGVHADLYDSHAWLTAWLTAAGAGMAPALRIPAVLEGDRPVALLPLVARTDKRWEWAGRGGARMRYRPVLDVEQASEQALGLLAEQVARAGVRDLTLERLPARDPATGTLVAALRQAGFTVYQRRTSSDCMAVVDGDWEEFRRRFASYDRLIKRMVKRLRPLWKLSFDEYRPGTVASVLDGFAVYADLYDRSWKGPLEPGMRARECELLRRTEPLGWPRVYVLRVGGRPVAAEVWFRLGKVATSLGTAYDQRMAAMSPGSIAVWWSQERLFAEATPRLIDHLPGYGPQKDKLGPDRTPILLVEAIQRTLVSGVTFPLRRQARYVLPRAAVRARRLGRRRRGPATRGRRPGGARTLEVAPGRAAGLPAERLELQPSMRRFLAVAGGHPSTETMARRWAQDDAWWRVGAGPAALVRLCTAGDRTIVREVVLLEEGRRPVTELLAALAATLHAPLTVDLPVERAGERATKQPIPVYRAMLGWPQGADGAPG
jgi:hypothetical protein